MFGYCVVQYVSLSVYARRTAGGGTRRQLHALAPAPRAAAAHGSPAIMRGCAADAQSMTEPMTGSRDIASPIPSEWTVELVWCVCVVCAAVEDQTESQGQTSVGRDSTLDTHKRREPDESQPARQSNPDQISNAQGSDLQCANRQRRSARTPLTTCTTVHRSLSAVACACTYCCTTLVPLVRDLRGAAKVYLPVRPSR